MDYFSIRTVTTNDIAEQEKQMATKLYYIAGNVSSILGQLSGNSALKSNLRSDLNSACESVSAQQGNMARLSAALYEATMEYEAVEKSTMVGVQLQSYIAENFGAIHFSSVGSMQSVIINNLLDWVEHNLTWEHIGTGAGGDILHDWLENQNFLNIIDFGIVSNGSGWENISLDLLGTNKDQKWLAEWLKNSALAPGIITGEEVFEKYFSLFDSDKNWKDIVEGAVGAVKSGWNTFIKNPAKLLDIELSSELKTTGDIIKMLDAGVGLGSAWVDYQDAKESGNSEQRVESYNEVIEKFAEFVKYPIGKGDTFKGEFVNPYTMGIDWIKNGLQNFNTELNKDDANVWDVMYGTFIDSALETVYETAASKMKIVGLDIAKVYENLSDTGKEGYEAVKEAFSDLYHEMEDAGSFTFQGYANGAKIMWNGIKDFGSDVVEGVGDFVCSAGDGIGEFFKEWF